MSLRKLVSPTLLTLALLGWAPAAAVAQEQEPVRIAVVDLDVVVAQSPAGKRLQEKLEAFQKEGQAELDKLTSAAQAIRERATSEELSEEELAQLQTEFTAKQNEIRQFRADKQAEGETMQNQGFEEIEKSLEPIFAEVRDEGNYDLILNRVPGVVVMAGPRVDITQKVLEKIRAAG